ncbi:MAG TPA: hypothetical protein VI636_12790 [Candidatus Angelobacter sp.]
MKRFKFKAGLIFASWALFLVFGCHKKKPPIPPQEQPPAISTTEQPSKPEPPPQNPQPPNPQPAQEQPEATNKPPEKPTPKHAKPHPVRKPAPETEKPVEVAKNNPPEPPPAPRVVIQEGGANPATGQTGTGAPGNDNQATTQQLLDSTENNLRNISKRQLSINEQSILAQIKDYVNQSKQAAKDGDLVRAHNLALKARLLSDDLAKSK